MLNHLKRLFKSSAIYGLGTALNQMLSLLILPLFTSYLTPEDYGVSSVLTIFSLFLIAIFSFGLGTSVGVVYYDQTEGYQRERVIGNALYVILPGCFVLYLFYLNSNLLSQLILNSTKYSYLIQLTILTVIVNLFVLPMTLKLQFDDKSLIFVMVSIIYNICTLSSSIYLIVMLNMGLTGRILGYAFGSFVNFLLIFIFVYKKINYSFDFKFVKALFINGAPIIPSFLSLFVLQQGNIYILKEVTSLTDVGLYSVGNTFGSFLSLFVSSFMTAWVPFALSFKNNPKEAGEVFGRVLLYYILSIGTLSFCLYAAAKPLVVMFTNPEFYPSYLIIGFSSTVQLFLGIFSILNIENHMAKQLRYTILAQIITALFFVPFSILLTISFKGLGAIIALVFSYLLMIFIIIHYNKLNKFREIKIKSDFKRFYLYLFFYFTFIFVINLFDFGFGWLQFIFNFVVLMLYFFFVYVYFLNKPEKSFVINKVSEYLHKVYRCFN